MLWCFLTVQLYAQSYLDSQPTARSSRHPLAFMNIREFSVRKDFAGISTHASSVGEPSVNQREFAFERVPEICKSLHRQISHHLTLGTDGLRLPRSGVLYPPVTSSAKYSYEYALFSEFAGGEPVPLLVWAHAPPLSRGSCHRTARGGRV